MPRGDGTGPMGMESMTGRGTGNCVGYVSPELEIRGVGFGKGMGGVRGRGLRRMFCHTRMQGRARNGYTSVMPRGQVFDEKAALKNQEDYLEKQLQQVKGRLKDFDDQK